LNAKSEAMKSKLLLGISLFVVGFIIAVIGFAAGSEPGNSPAESHVVGDQNEPARNEVASMMLPVIAGVSIVAGAVLIGIGMGSLKRQKIVPPDSPQADEAATTRPMSHDVTSMPGRRARGA
jgi:hypothetical protein